MPRKINIVPHTHWDREWYLPFQTYRTKLVKLIDSLLDFLETNESFKCFMLDGQLAVVDDYLQIRPENQERLEVLAKNGRIKMGPWYILMDEFLVSGETIIRNLKLGIEKARVYGGHMPIGYLPDMFGHIGQMPQILNLVGIDSAVVWRGVPSAIKSHRFQWNALDGSAVNAEFLMSGYGNGANLPNDPVALINRIAGYEKQMGEFIKDDPLLYMNGSDHLFYQSFLPDVIQSANKMQSDYIIEINSLPDSLLKDEPEISHNGELRSSAYSNLLMGVTSNRTDIRLLARQTETLVESLVEPLYSLFSSSYPRAYLNLVWKNLILNSAHDSICACSINEVVEIVKSRYIEARQICNALIEDLYSELSKKLNSGDNFVLNPCAKTIDSVIEFEVDNHDEIIGTQILVRSGTGLDAPLISLKSSEVAIILTQLNSNQIDDKTFVVGVDIDVQGDKTKVKVIIDSVMDPEFSVDTTLDRLKNTLAEYPDNMVDVWLSSSPKQRLLAVCDIQPGYTLRPLSIKTNFQPINLSQDDSKIEFSNKHLKIELNKSDGSFTLNGVDGFNALVDSGDQGDTYNYSPPEFDTFIDTPISASTEIIQAGPIKAIVKIDRIYSIPAYIDDISRSREDSTTLKVITFLELNANENFVRVTHQIENTAKDHRLRAVFPIQGGAAESLADTAFGEVKRGLYAEGGITEVGIPTFPALSYIRAGNITILLDCVGEYELTDIENGVANSISLTLIRSVKYLSRITMTNRPLSAGPNLETSDAQMQGFHSFTYAVAVDEDLDVYEAKARYVLPFKVIRGTGSENSAINYPKLEISNCEISAITKSQEKLEIRVFNPTDSLKTAEIKGCSGSVIDLLGNPIESFNGSIDLRAFGIATIRLDRF